MTEHHSLKRRLGADTLRRRLAKHDGDTLCNVDGLKVVGDRMALRGCWSIAELKSYLRARQGRRIEECELSVCTGEF